MKLSSADRRAQEKERVRTLILDAARKLFLSVGLDGFSMRKLGDMIGYTPTGIYFHYADKETLLQALMDEDCQALRLSVQKSLAEADPVRRLMLIGWGYVQFALAHPQHYRLLMMTPGHTRSAELTKIERGNPNEDGYAFLRAAVDYALAADVFRPEYHDHELISQMLWATVHGISSAYIAKGQDQWIDWRPVEETARHMIKSMLRGMLRDPARITHEEALP
ncbi:MAG: TetR/AcrR family transcriptional regulator [Pirellulales bacterium]|nr:TetR/AcrR family transcriptional regulator [Pirellulales bacterium]